MLANLFSLFYSDQNICAKENEIFSVSTEYSEGVGSLVSGKYPKNGHTRRELTSCQFSGTVKKQYEGS